MITPALLFAPESSTVYLIGGTLVSHSPPVKYLELILFPLLKSFGIQAGIHIVKDGYYPSGGGEAELAIERVSYKNSFSSQVKSKLKPINLTTQGKIRKVYIELVTDTNDEATANGYLKELSDLD